MILHILLHDLNNRKKIFVTPQPWVISRRFFGDLLPVEAIWIRPKVIKTYISVEKRRCSTIHHIMMRMMYTVVIKLLIGYILHKKKFCSMSTRYIPICLFQQFASWLEPWCFRPPKISSIYIISLQNSTCLVIKIKESG